MLKDMTIDLPKLISTTHFRPSHFDFEEVFIFFLYFLFLLILSPAHALVLNNPYPASDSTKKIYYTSFTEQPKTLDPAKSYELSATQFIEQIYETTLQYDYFVRPYKLIPLTAATFPSVRYFDALGKPLSASSKGITTSVYTIRIKPGIYFQPHPAFAKNAQEEYEYLNLPSNYLKKNKIHQLSDFKKTGTRELIAEDYVYEIKRLANPHVNSPIYSLMGERIVGFFDYAKQLPQGRNSQWIDLRLFPLSGVRVLDRYQYEISIKGEFPQFLYWLAMSFFAPIPWEADQFYNQPGMSEHNISFDWYPVGTGPFMLTENNPNRRMAMMKNPNFHEEYFPSNGTKEDIALGYLKHAGERVPLVDQIIFILEKETIPRWNKFLQGYYDLSGIAADSFDQAIHVSPLGNPELTPAMREKGFALQQVNELAIYYFAFNMQDATVGGTSERARLLRLAIAIALDFDEYISVFLNGRGTSSQGPIPSGIFGFREGAEGINPYVYRWDNGQKKRRSIQEARALMKEAGYQNGIDPKTKKPLILHYDVPSSGQPDEKSQLNWMKKKLAAIGIDLDIRATQVNRFQDNLRYGNVQLFSSGWIADYPDPENFLFLLYGPNGKVNFGGENLTNYSNLTFDQLFTEMKNKPNNAERLALIDKMIEIIRHDVPWAGGFYSQSLLLRQQWISMVKPSSISHNHLKYVAIDVPLRDKFRNQWNQAILWPIPLMLAGFLLMFLPFVFAYRYKQQLPVKRTEPK